MPIVNINININSGSLGIMGRTIKQGENAILDLDTATYEALQQFQESGVLTIVSEETSPVVSLPLGDFKINY